MGTFQPNFFRKIARSLARARVDGATRRYKFHKTAELAYLKKHTPVAVEVVNERVRDEGEDWTYRMYLPGLLSKLDTEAAARTCLELMRDSAVHKRVRQAAVETIDRMALAGQSPYFELLVGFAQDAGAGDLAYVSALALCHSKRREAIAVAGVYMLDHCSEILRPKVEKALDELDPQWGLSTEASALVPSILAIFARSSVKERRRAAQLMEQIPDARFADVLRPLASRYADSVFSTESGAATPRVLSSDETMLSYQAHKAMRVIANRHELADDLTSFAEFDRRIEESKREQQERGREARQRARDAARGLYEKIRGGVGGMTLQQVTTILGAPSSSSGGGDVLGRFGSVTASADAVSRLRSRDYYVWRRPEGEWKLVFVNGDLDSIYDSPFS